MRSRPPLEEEARILRAGIARDLARPNGSAPHPAAKLDLDWLPGPVRLVCDDVSSTWKQDADAHATAALAVLLVAIGANVQLRVPGGDLVPALNWFALVGPSGSGKTPIMEALLAPLRERQRRWDEEYRADLRRWQRVTREGGQPAREAGDKPKARTLVWDDTTFEALTVGLAEADDTGSVWYSDELLGLFNSLDQYKSRAGRSVQGLLSMWRANPIRRQRIRDGELTIVGRPVVSILGGLQPSKLHELGSNDDGRLARILPVRVRMGADSAERDPEPDLLAAWRDLVLALLDSRPAGIATLGLEAEAEEHWRERAALRRLEVRALPEQEQEVVGPFVAKLDQHVGRLALALHAGDRGCAWPLPELGADVIRRAWALGEWYLEQQLALFVATALSIGQRPYEVEKAHAVARFDAWMRERWDPPASKREVQRVASRWLRGSNFQSIVDDWRRLGYGEVVKEGRALLLNWEPEEAPEGAEESG